MAKVSVIFPVYNCLPYLRQAVDSILEQTFQDYELIIIEDCSTDASKAMVKGYEREYPQVRVIWHEENKGLGCSLNDGLQVARGEFIAIQHGDDVSLPSRLERQVEYMNVHPNIDLISTRVRFIDEHNDINTRRSWWIKQMERTQETPEAVRKKMMEMNIFVHTSVMFRRSLIDEVGLYDNEMVPAEDYDYWLRIMDKHDAGIVPEVLCYYRHHSGQVSGTDSGNAMRRKAEVALERARTRRS